MICGKGGTRKPFVRDKDGNWSVGSFKILLTQVVTLMQARFHGRLEASDRRHIK